MKQPKLTITFHNPNTTEELVAELVKIAAEVAAEKVRKEIINSNWEQENNLEYDAEMTEPQLSM